MEDQQFAEFVFHIKDSSPQDYWRVVFLPKKSWAIQEYEIKTPKRQDYSIGKYTYEGEIDGIPLLKEYIRKRFKIENNVPVCYEELKYKSIKYTPGPPPLEDFDPEKVLGIKIGGSGANWTLRSFLLGIGGGFIAIWLYFNRKSKRHS